MRNILVIKLVSYSAGADLSLTSRENGVFMEWPKSRVYAERSKDSTYSKTHMDLLHTNLQQTAPISQALLVEWRSATTLSLFFGVRSSYCKVFLSGPRAFHEQIFTHIIMTTHLLTQVQCTVQVSCSFVSKPKFRWSIEEKA